MLILIQSKLKWIPHWIKNSILGIRKLLKGKIIISHSIELKMSALPHKKIIIIWVDWHFLRIALISKSKQIHARPTILNMSPKPTLKTRLGRDRSPAWCQKGEREEGTAGRYLCVSENLWHPCLPRLTAATLTLCLTQHPDSYLPQQSYSKTRLKVKESLMLLNV